MKEELKAHFNVNPEIGDFIRGKCNTLFKLFMSNINRESTQVQSSQSTPSDSQNSSSQTSGSDPTVIYSETVKKYEDYVELPIPRTVSTHKYCFLCKEKQNLIQVPFNARKQVYIARKIYIPEGNRCCEQHLIKKRFYELEMNRIDIKSRCSSIKVSDVTYLLVNLRIDVDKELTDKIADFSLPEDRLIILTGLTWENLIYLREMLTSLRNSESRSVTQALVVFLFKLRSGNSNNIIHSVLGLDRPQQVFDFCASVIKSFEQDVLPTRFGFQAIGRETLIRHTAPIARILHDIKDDELGLVCDATYLYHEKSENNDYQRKSYSGQKKKPLCKPFTVCTTNGYIVDIFGPFYANQNDAQILDQLLSEPNGLKNILKEGDSFFLDRGFRDVIGKLEDLKFKAHMPALKGQRKQLTTAEANASRMVTLVRWVVEAVHGVMGQKYKLLHNQFDNKMIPNARSYCRIAGFLVNTFGKRYLSEVSSSDEVINQIKRNKTTKNTLQEEVESKSWNRRKSNFMPLKSDDVLDFPELTRKDLEVFFTGTYQMKQAVSYLAELMGNDDQINLSYLKESKDILKIQIRSRHKQSKTYNCYIQYQPEAIGASAINRYYCDCPNGTRTIGCCSHVATVIFFLSHARYLSKIVRPSEILTNIFDPDMIPVINDDSDED